MSQKELKRRIRMTGMRGMGYFPYTVHFSFPNEASGEIAVRDYKIGCELVRKLRNIAIDIEELRHG